MIQWFICSNEKTLHNVNVFIDFTVLHLNEGFFKKPDHINMQR